MADRTPGPLEVVGQLMVDMGGSSARIDAQGDRIVVALPNLRAGASSLRQWTRGRGVREALGGLHRLLMAAGLTLEVAVGGSTVGLLGVNARPGLASRLLGFNLLEIRLGGLLGSFRRRADQSGRRP